jgi:hypothetical protein
MPNIPNSIFATDASRMDSPAEVFASMERRMGEAFVVIADSDHSEKCRMGLDKTDPDEMDNVLSSLSDDLSQHHCDYCSKIGRNEASGMLETDLATLRIHSNSPILWGNSRDEIKLKPYGLRNPFTQQTRFHIGNDKVTNGIGLLPHKALLWLFREHFQQQLVRRTVALQFLVVEGFG